MESQNVKSMCSWMLVWHSPQWRYSFWPMCKMIYTGELLWGKASTGLSVSRWASTNDQHDELANDKSANRLVRGWPSSQIGQECTGLHPHYSSHAHEEWPVHVTNPLSPSWHIYGEVAKVYRDGKTRRLLYWGARLITSHALCMSWCLSGKITVIKNEHHLTYIIGEGGAPINHQHSVKIWHG